LGLARRLLLIVDIVVPSSAVGRLPRLEIAVSDGSLATALRAGTGFNDLTALSYTRDGKTINQQGPTKAPKVTTPRPTYRPTVPPLANAVTVLPDSEVAIVEVVMGLSEEPPSKGSDGGMPVWEDKFDFSRASAQVAFEAICKLAVQRSAKLKTRKQMCFVNDFDIFLKSLATAAKPLRYPYGSPDVHKLLGQFMSDPRNKGYKEHVGFTAGGARVRFVKAKFYTDLPRDMAASDAWKYVEEWDKFLEEMNKKYWNSGTGKLFHTSALWVRAETEERLIESTLMCAGFSIFFALLAVLLFLWNMALAVFLILGIICVIICLAALMFGVMGWTFGAVEAIGLIVFVGFSVDYSLHMAESFNQSKEKLRFNKVQDAMLRTGGAVFAAAVTSTLAGIPILLCTIRVFVKFGVTIVLNTALSLFFSLGFLCALLTIIGPVDDFGSCNMLLDLLRGKKRTLNPEPVLPGVVGTVVGVAPGGAGDYSWGGGAPSSGYKWDTGEDDPDDPKKPQKGAPPQMSGAAETATASEEENPEASAAAAEGNQVLQMPVRVTTPTRTMHGDVQPQTMGATSVAASVRSL